MFVSARIVRQTASRKDQTFFLNESYNLNIVLKNKPVRWIMPLFEYHCESCDQTFEKLSKTQENATPCPDCKQEAAKVVSVFAASAGCAAPSGSGFG
jgi:putative FmdB family regulatory protein